MNKETLNNKETFKIFFYYWVTLIVYTIAFIVWKRMSFRGMWWNWNAWKWRLLDQEHCKCCMHKLIKMYKYTIQSNECTNKWMNGWMGEATLEWMSECLKDVRARLQYQYTCTHVQETSVLEQHAYICYYFLFFF